MLPRVKAEVMNLAVKAAMPTRTQQQLSPGAGVGGLFSGSGTTSRDAVIAALLARIVGRGSMSSQDFTRMPDLPSSVGPHSAYTHPGLGGFTRIPDLFGETEKFTPNVDTSGPKVSIRADLRGLFSGQKTGIGVPGVAPGMPTREQTAFLNAVVRSSYNKPPVMTTDGGQRAKMPIEYNPSNPSVVALMQHLGKPSTIRMMENTQSQALNPLSALIVEAARGPLPLSVGRERLGLGPGHGVAKDAGLDQMLSGVGDTAGHERWLNYLMQKNAIQRRN